MFIPKHNCLFVHIPKNAGRSIGRFLTDKGGAHERAIDYKYKEPSAFESFFKFAIVRNPWDRIVSNYLFAKKCNNTITKTLWTKFGIQYPEQSFADWVLFTKRLWENGLSPKYDKTVNGNLVWHHGPQIYWVSDEKGNLIVDFIGRFESLNEDFAYICGRLGLKKKILPHINKSKNHGYRRYYDRRLAEEVGKIYVADIKRFEYKF